MVIDLWQVLPLVLVILCVLALFFLAGMWFLAVKLEAAEQPKRVGGKGEDDSSASCIARRVARVDVIIADEIERGVVSADTEKDYLNVKHKGCYVLDETMAKRIDSTIDLSWLIPTHITGVHPYTFKCGEKAEIIRIELWARWAFVCRYEDGTLDTVPLCDLDNYLVTGEPHD